MAGIVAVGTANPPYRLHQDEIKEYINQMLSHSRDDLKKLISAFDNSTVEIRHFVQPKEWFNQLHSFRERNEVYIKHASNLSVEAICRCFKKARYTKPDHIVFVSTTGIATPSIDAIIINKLRLDNHIKRTPIWGLGCVGGAVGLSRAFEYTTAFPNSLVLLVTLEICSLAFHKDDLSKSHIIATALFSDGAAAALIAGEKNVLFSLGNIRIVGSFSTTYYDTLDIMGWDIEESGFKVIFSKDIPAIVRKHIRNNVEEFISRYNLGIDKIKHFIVHPGGPKVLKAYEDALGISEEALVYSYRVLRMHGNMSSSTVLYVLNEFIENKNYKPGEYGLISALGPGFTSELLLFQTL
ncbi:MAG: putative chalcone synthase [Deltaproteobacteria bacterium]|jgi:alkylresorcinol/alkylpyrone synthase|nr:MAG: putative chalcone synthase [Deltaproteobacteria bacterium]